MTVSQDGLVVVPEGYYLHTRPEVMPFLPPRIDRALDVGCAAGRFGAQIKACRGAEVWGLEADPGAAALATVVLDRVLAGDALSSLRQLPDQYFDTVICSDVLEHMVNPGQFLRELRPKLNEDARVIASIPNVRYYPALRKILFDADFPYADEGIFDRTHLRFFTRKSMLRLFAESGYRVDRIEGINPTRSRSFSRWNTVLLGTLEDCRYLQYVVVASAQRTGP